MQLILTFLVFLSITSGCRNRQTSELNVVNGNTREDSWIILITKSIGQGKHKVSTGSMLCPNLILSAGHILKKSEALSSLQFHLSRSARKSLKRQDFPFRPIERFDLEIEDLATRPPTVDSVAMFKFADESLSDAISSSSSWVFPKISSNPPATYLTLNGYGQFFKETLIKQPHVGQVSFYKYAPAMVAGKKHTKALLYHGIRTKKTVDITSTNKSEGLFQVQGKWATTKMNAEHHAAWQRSEPGDSGGPLTMTSKSNEIVSINSRGIDKELIEEDFVNFQKKIGSEREKASKNLEKSLYSISINVMIEPVKKFIYQTMRDQCPAKWVTENLN